MGGGFIKDKTWDKITDPLGIFGGKAGGLADPLGIISKSSAETAEQRAARLEAERQENIRRASAEVERIYGSPERQQQYTDFYNATRDLGMADLNKQKTIADRQAKFGLARGGLTGGSRAVDLGSQLGREYTDGLLTVDQRALAAKADLMGADQQAKNNLLALTQSGLDLTTAQQNAAAAMQANLQSGEATRLAGGLGDIFGTASDFYKKSEEERVRRQTEQSYGQTLYSPYYSYGSGRG